MYKISNYLKLDIGTLKNVKLVLGNGFDLACGLNSSYAAFFQSQTSLYKEIDDWINGNGEFPQLANAWDLLFLILSKQDLRFQNTSKIEWKDIETVIREVLVGKSKYISYSFENVINGDNLDDSNSKCILAFLNNHVDITNKEEAYEFLYQELIRFEKRFSDFLKVQEDDPIYNQNARTMLTKTGLLKMYDSEVGNQLISIDTFNYTTPKIFEELPDRVSIRHINGKIGSAIFGIDSEGIKVSDYAYRFTKAYRKMIDLVNGGREDFKRNFKNVVIYGHSLSKADYSYFYSILDVIDLGKYDRYESRLVIGFTDFYDNDEKNEKNRRKLADNLIELLSGYDHYINPYSQRHGIIEMLETSDRVGFAKIDTNVLVK